jgi:hypothetical protein
MVVLAPASRSWFSDAARFADRILLKTLPGRKTDVLECQWLQKLHTFGLLNNSFRPAEEIQVLRTYLRQRENLVAAGSTCIQHLQKTLTQMNVQLANVISDISGVTGMAILRAIVAGERDPERLSTLKHNRVRASREEIARSLEGNWREELLFVLERMPRVHHVDLKSVALQDLEKGYPINARCLHNDCLYAARLQPLRHAMQVRREASECLHWRGISPRGYRDIMFSVANINPCRVPIQRREPFIPLSLGFIFRLCWFRHLESSSISKWDETRPGCDRFENVSNGVEPADRSARCHQITDRHHRNHG